MREEGGNPHGKKPDVSNKCLVNKKDNTEHLQASNDTYLNCTFYIVSGNNVTLNIGASSMNDSNTMGGKILKRENATSSYASEEMKSTTGTTTTTLENDRVNTKRKNTTTTLENDRESTESKSTTTTVEKYEKQRLQVRNYMKMSVLYW